MENNAKSIQKVSYLAELEDKLGWLYEQPKEDQDLILNGIGSRQNWLFRKFNFKGWLYRLVKRAVDKHDIAYTCGGDFDCKRWADARLEDELIEIANQIIFGETIVRKAMVVVRSGGLLSWEFREYPLSISECLAKLKNEKVS